MIHYVHDLDIHLFLTHPVYRYKSAIAGQTDRPNGLIFLGNPWVGTLGVTYKLKKFEIFFKIRFF